MGKICFTCICSFKKDEEESFEGHSEVDVRDRWKDVLGERKSNQWEEAPGQDAPW